MFKESIEKQIFNQPEQKLAEEEKIQEILKEIEYADKMIDDKIALEIQEPINKKVITKEQWEQEVKPYLLMQMFEKGL